ncbi:hypothetical protein C1645_837884 [Glomus cerebriforme]|uniref:F-box domain-containing protein n=1 Tax=Glomus cerebriforme TaxID=658196 RepID=A0A397S399_9GLOM|nr:hypothetical protein C1645_837884 [Glomus cerebriforme]
MSQLLADCLNEIFKYLENDNVTLYSCLLVNHLWCKVSVRILWRSIRNYGTLINCLPNESKEILYENGIIISSSKPPMFNYASFCKSLSIGVVNDNIELLLKQQQSIPIQNLLDNTYIVSQEIFKLLMNQTSLRKLIMKFIPRRDIIFASFPGAKDCLKNLSELHCGSGICPEFFYQLSQICHKIQTLYISSLKVVSNGLTDLISAQKNLKFLHMIHYYNCEGLKDIYNLLTKFPNTLNKLHIYAGRTHVPLSFIAKFTNLNEIVLSFYESDAFEDFKTLQYVRFLQLKNLEFEYECPRNELLIKFLELNGRYLKKFKIIKSNDQSLNLTIMKFCPNIEKLSGLTNNESELLKMFFNNCQYLESIKIYCEGYFSEKNLFEVVTKYSPKNFYELELNYSYYAKSELLPDDLESFFVNWTHRVSQKPLSLIITGINKYSFKKNDKNKKIVDKYVELGIVKFFEFEE